MSGLESHLSLVTAPFDIPVRDGLDHCELGKSSERCRWVVGYWIWLHWFFYLCDPIHIGSGATARRGKLWGVGESKQLW